MKNYKIIGIFNEKLVKKIFKDLTINICKPNVNSRIRHIKFYITIIEFNFFLEPKCHTAKYIVCYGKLKFFVKAKKNFCGW